jgi:Spy/CpxP family protein refolding chaperone
MMKGKTRIWIGMILLFISGVAVGFFGSGLVIRKHVREFVQKGPAHMNARVVEHAIHGMDLTDEQRAKIDAIVEETTPEMRRMSTEFGDSLETLATAQFEAIKALLDEEQVKVLEQRMEEIRKRMMKRGGRQGGRPGGRDHREEEPPGG